MLKSVTQKQKRYHTNETLLADMLHLLDLTLLRIFAGEEEKNQGDNPWKGLVISPDEIHRLLFQEEETTKTGDALRLDKLIDQKWEEIQCKRQLSDSSIPLNHLFGQFQLDDVGEFLVILGLANTLHAKYERIFGYLNDNVARKHPTYDILAKVLNLDTREKINLKKKLMDPWGSYRLLLKWEEDEGVPFFSKEIKLVDRIQQYLLGTSSKDEANLTTYRVVPAHEPAELMLVHNNVFENIWQSYQKCPEGIFMVSGDSGVGKKYLLEHMASCIPKPVLFLDASTMITGELSLSELLKHVRMEMQLSDCLVVLDHIEAFFQNTTQEQVHLKNWISHFKRSKNPLFLLAHDDINITKVSDDPILKYKLSRPTYDERYRLWASYTEQMKVEDINIYDVSEKFKFTPLQIKNTVNQYSLSANHEEGVSIYEIAKEQIHHKLHEKASLVRPVFTWDQLVLPKEQAFILKSICAHVERKHQVFSQWGFEQTMPYGVGTAVVFSGPPGTGKTMAAQVLSKALKLDLYKIDLSQMVSKYIGETEKNLHQIFHEAAISNAILFFDEADALFGKRSEVKEAKDRFANIEVSYLLQKIEEYEGIIILATNYLNNIDKAFLRRIRFIVDFPFPDEHARKRIWELSIPDQVPMDSDVDFDYLARTFELAGGSIKNILINSAFFAADAGENLSMKEIVKAAGYELQKMDKLLLKSDLKEYSYLLDEI